MSKTSGTIDLKSIKQAATGAVSYITDMDNNGIFVHEKSASQVTPTSSNANGVQITSNVDIIRGGESVAQYGSDARIGKANEGRLVITNSDVTVYGKINKKALSFGSTNDSDGIATITEYLQINYMVFGGIQALGATTSYKISSIQSCYKNGEETQSVVMNIKQGTTFDFVYNDSDLTNKDYIKITYITNSQISFLEIGNSCSSSGGNSVAIGYMSKAGGANSLSLGEYSESSGKNSFAMGANNQVFSRDSFSAGHYNIVEGIESAAIGGSNKINKDAWSSFVAGSGNTATGQSSIALGNENVSSGFASVATGQGTIANGDSSFTCGKYNIQNSSVAFAVGNGTDDNRSDAFWVSNVGNIGFTGIAYTGQPNNADRVPLFATGTKTAEITINAGATSPTAQSINIAKTGYTPWAINGIDITSPSCNLYRYFIDGNKLYYRLYNTSSSSITVTITARISYIATSALYIS